MSNRHQFHSPLALVLVVVLGFDLINGVFLSVMTVLFCILLVEALGGRLMCLWGMAPFGTLLSGALVEAFDGGYT